MYQLAFLGPDYALEAGRTFTRLSSAERFARSLNTTSAALVCRCPRPGRVVQPAIQTRRREDGAEEQILVGDVVFWSEKSDPVVDQDRLGYALLDLPDQLRERILAELAADRHRTLVMGALDACLGGTRALAAMARLILFRRPEGA